METLQEILENLDANAPMTLEEIIQAEVSDWERSDERKQMLNGKRYYRIKNDILDQRRKTIDGDGRLVAAENLADNRIPHGFVRKLVDQKAGYLLSKPFLPKTALPAYQDELELFFDDDFKLLFKNLGKDAVNCGKAWLHPYYTVDGELAFMRMNPEECLPIWKDAAHTELAAFIRVYEIEGYVAKRKQTVKRIEWWDLDGVRIYEEEAGKLKLLEQQNHLAVVEGTAERPLNWERVPFVCFKYNSEEQPLIELIKKQVDDYDKQKSANSNNLEDLPNSIYVVKNYSGQEAGDFRKNIAQFRVAFVDHTGGVETISLDLDTEAYSNHMEMTRKDIFEFGRGVDTQSDKFASAPSGVALRSLYQDLDLDCNDIESEFQAGLKQLLWFIDTHLAAATGKDYTEEPVTFIFNRDVLINESEAITDASNSTGVISRETIVANHPWVTDTKEELKRIEAEEQAALEKMEDYGLPPNQSNPPEEVEPK
ncbi:phage portal protein [Paenibacillus sp. IHBB 3054]|uniref:phage portal protein n=1 Tax=Paenibacillus sp. IHBB 3054 TaxID=3425689 RepID=UPI003F6713AC